MITSVLYDITIVMYTISVCMYLIDFLHHNRKAGQAAFWLLSIVWFFQLTLFITEAVNVGEFPILTPADGLFFLAWMLVSASIMIHYLARVEFLVFFVNLVGFIVMSMAVVKPEQDPSLVLTRKLMSDLLIVHITIAFIAYTAFTISFILSMMYLLEYQMLKKKKWGRRLVRFGSMSKLEQLSFLCNAVGLPLLTISLFIGIVRAETSVATFSWFDPKVVLSFIVIIAYLSYMFQRLAKKLSGKPLIYWNITGFLVLLINIFLSGALTDFHLW